MSINWVMTSPTEEGFVRLPNEKVLYVSPSRTSLSISSVNTFPGTEPFSVKSDGGVVYITNQRIVYLPTTPTPELQSFSAPILNLEDTYVRAPFFGANYWTAQVKPVPGGGIPPQYPAVEIRMTFREGGAYDYHTVFEQIKERLHHAVSLAREEGRNIGSTGTLNPADLANVDLEQLPPYEPARSSGHAGSSEDRGLMSSNSHTVTNEAESSKGSSSTMDSTPPKSAQEVFSPPNEPPPGYEEAQAQAMSIDFDQRLREEAGRL